MAFSKLDALASVAELIGGNDEKNGCDTQKRRARRRAPGKRSNGEAGGPSYHDRWSAYEYGSIGIEAEAQDACTAPPLDLNGPSTMDPASNVVRAVAPVATKPPAPYPTLAGIGSDSATRRDQLAFNEQGGGSLENHILTVLPQKRISPSHTGPAPDADGTWARAPAAKRRNASSNNGRLLLLHHRRDNSSSTEGHGHGVHKTDEGDFPPPRLQSINQMDEEPHPGPLGALPRWSSSSGFLAQRAPAVAGDHKLRYPGGRPSPGVSAASDEPCTTSHIAPTVTGGLLGRGRVSVGSQALAAAINSGERMPPAPAAMGPEPSPTATSQPTAGRPGSTSIPTINSSHVAAAAAATSLLPQEAPAAAPAAAATGLGADPTACLSMLAQSPSKGGPDLLEKMRIAETLLTHRDQLGPRLVQLVIQQLAELCQSVSVDDLVARMAAAPPPQQATTPTGIRPKSNGGGYGAHKRMTQETTTTVTTAPSRPGPVALGATAARAWIPATATTAAAVPIVASRMDKKTSIAAKGTMLSQTHRIWCSEQAAVGPASCAGGAGGVSAAVVTSPPMVDNDGSTSSSSSSSSRTATHGSMEQHPAATATTARQVKGLIDRVGCNVAPATVAARTADGQCATAAAAGTGQTRDGDPGTVAAPGLATAPNPLTCPDQSSQARCSGADLASMPPPRRPIPSLAGKHSCTDVTYDAARELCAAAAATAVTTVAAGTREQAAVVASPPPPQLPPPLRTGSGGLVLERTLDPPVFPRSLLHAHMHAPKHRPLQQHIPQVPPPRGKAPQQEPLPHLLQHGSYRINSVERARRWPPGTASVAQQAPEEDFVTTQGSLPISTRVPPPQHVQVGTANAASGPSGGGSSSSSFLPLGADSVAPALQQQQELLPRPRELLTREGVLDLVSRPSVTTAMLIAALAERARSISGVRRTVELDGAEPGARGVDGATTATVQQEQQQGRAAGLVRGCGNSGDGAPLRPLPVHPAELMHCWPVLDHEGAGNGDIDAIGRPAAEWRRAVRGLAARNQADDAAFSAAPPPSPSPLPQKQQQQSLPCIATAAEMHGAQAANAFARRAAAMAAAAASKTAPGHDEHSRPWVAGGGAAAAAAANLLMMPPPLPAAVAASGLLHRSVSAVAQLGEERARGDVEVGTPMGSGRLPAVAALGEAGAVALGRSLSAGLSGYGDAHRYSTGGQPISPDAYVTIRLANTSLRPAAGVASGKVAAPQAPPPTA